MTRCILILLTFTTLMLTASGAVPASLPGRVQSMEEQDKARAAMKSGEVMVYSKLKKLVEKKTGGTIVGQRLRRTGRGWMYELRVRGVKGQVHFLIVNAQTGEIINKGRR